MTTVGDTLAELRRLGIKPKGYNLDSPYGRRWTSDNPVTTTLTAWWRPDCGALHVESNPGERLDTQCPDG